MPSYIGIVGHVYLGQISSTHVDKKYVFIAWPKEVSKHLLFIAIQWTKCSITLFCVYIQLGILTNAVPSRLSNKLFRLNTLTTGKIMHGHRSLLLFSGQILRLLWLLKVKATHESNARQITRFIKDKKSTWEMYILYWQEINMHRIYNVNETDAVWWVPLLWSTK